LLQRDTSFVFYSDDSCLNLKTKRGNYRCNLDIATCDLSHSPALFEVIRHLADGTCFEESLNGVVDQLMLPVKIVSPHNKNHRVTLFTNKPHLLSGSTITTLINNFANLLIFSEIMSFRHSKSRNPERDVINAAERAGYVVKCENVKFPEGYQFLKHSPYACVDGGYAPGLNLGVILRLFGSCKGDLPGRAVVGLVERARRFNASLVASLKHAGHYLLMDKLRMLYPHGKVIETHSYLVDTCTGVVNCRFSEASICKRYNMSSHEYHELCDSFSVAGLGTMIFNTAVVKILSLDYGLLSSYLKV